MTEPSPDPERMLGPDGPAWIREAWTLAWHEARGFVATSVGFIRRPSRFGADWVAGRQRALNPLGFIATALAIGALVGALLRHGGDESLALQLEHAILPYVYYALLGVLAHPLLRVGGSRRGLSTSLAIALFAGGGPGLVSALSIYLVVAWCWLTYGSYSSSLVRGLPMAAQIIASIWVYGCFIMFIVTLAFGLAGAHGLRRRRAAVAMIVSLFVLGSGMGLLHEHTHIALGVPHIVITFFGVLPLPDIWF